ncbi:CheB methylesterase domain-containing protein [Geomonas edaphica]|uniref:CheB methylesterase domain-containing protein n=1 Tax=Geomonas edaphica TaxID=2570226 RepID=UPI0010A88D55|nr:CheB methylesterase domain-containing protein [Geomonas edaphica]
MSARNLVVIGVSTGGPLTLKALFKEIPPLDAAFLIVLHITPQMDYRIAQGLAAAATMPVTLAEDGEYLKHGHIYMAPGGFHLKLEGNQRVVLYEGARVNYVQPAADVAMLSVSRPLKGKLVGIVLTGMGRDGADGIKHIHDIGGITIAQDQHSSTIYGMPKAAALTGAVDHVLPPKKIAAKLIELLA